MSDNGVSLMDLGLYSCGVGYRYIPVFDDTELHSTFFSIPGCGNTIFTQYIFEYLFSWLKVYLWTNITKQTRSFIADTMNYLLFASDNKFWLMDLKLYSSGVGYKHIFVFDGTKLHSKFSNTNFPDSKYVCGQLLQIKRISITAKMLNYLLIKFKKWVWHMDLGLYSCGGGYIHIPECGNTKFHSIF